MRLICISDTHSRHKNMKYNLLDYINPKDYNVLIHCGDISMGGYKQEVTEFIEWYQNLKGFDEKIFIAGNHDFCFEEINQPHHKGDYDWLNHLLFEENLSQSNCTYLEDNELVITLPEFSKPIKFYGSPWQPEFHNWAFNLPRNGAELEHKWSLIPDDTDVLITHSPPFGYGDYVKSNIRVGCELLKNKLDIVKPKVHIYGHIHEAYGVSIENNTLFINASTCDLRYLPNNEPQVIELKEYYGEIIASHIYAE